MRGLPIVLSAVVFATSCATSQPRVAQKTGLLRLEVEPSDAIIWVDGEYLGQANGWLEGTLRLPVGARRVELEAAGYMSQRFDIAITNHEEVILRLAMQPDIEDLDDVSEDS